MVLPWHLKTIHQFNQESAVEGVLSQNADPARAVYIIPNPQGEKLMAKSDIRTRLIREKVEKGPFAFVAVSPNGLGPMGKQLTISIAIQFMSAFLMAWILSHVPNRNFQFRVTFVVATFLLASVICELPYWNWWGFSTEYIVTNIADHLIGGLILGLVIAKKV